MRFDDRLATVLAQPGESARERAIRWRQLVDLVARAGERADPAMLSDAMAAIRADHLLVDEAVRAATARAIAGRTLPLPLLQLFIGDAMTVAAPLLASLPTDADSLAALRAAASDQVRPVLDSLGARAPAPPPPPPPPAAVAAPPPEPEPPAPVPSLDDVVARIERLRSSRERAPAPGGGDVAGVQRAPALFRWECDPSGDIDWVEGAPRGALVGRSIASADAEDGVDERVERAFGVRAAFRDCRLELGEEGALAGPWMISGVPAFSPSDGRFIGYRGIARREEAEEPALPMAPGGEGPADHDWLREMMHEIKTPLNAIIGFAEIIDGQYFGPAHSRYRQRAAEIVANARSLLAAAEDLDFAARLQSARTRPGGGTAVADFFADFAEDLQASAVRHGAVLELDLAGAGTGRMALDPELIERLLRRFSDAVLGAGERGEPLRLAVRARRGRCEVAMTRPRATLLAGKDELLDPEFTIGEGEALLGLGFSLRLVNGLVGIAGGTLDISDGEFALSLPLAAA